jgi:uncharacterized DUF497 family protein
VIVEWDDEKAEANLRKHRVSFADAVEALEDPLSLTFPDPDHSLDEARYLTFGHDRSGRILVVAHADREAAVRLISARRATRGERRSYEEA